MATTIGKISCTACGGPALVNEGKSGTLSIACQAVDCRSLTMVKSPNAVAKLRARLSGEPKPAASSSSRDPVRDLIEGKP